MDIAGTTAFVTGGQIGLGAALTSELLARGATKVYVASRHPVDSSEPRVVPLALDIRDRDQVAAAAARADDVSLLVNNAGVFKSTDLLSADVAEIRDEFDTNVFGTLAMVRAFAPVLAAHGGGAVVNVLSVLAWASARDGYSASRAALWSVTNGLRSLLAPSGTLVTGVHVGWMDTPLTAAFDVPKAQPVDVARQVLDGVEGGRSEVLADGASRSVKQMLTGDPAALVFSV